MHELGLAKEILDLVVRHLPQGARMGGPCVESIDLVIGRFAGVENETLRFAFGALKKETPCAQAELHIEKVDPKVRCRKCGNENLPFPCEACPACGASDLESNGGLEFFVRSFTIREETGQREGGSLLNL